MNFITKEQFLKQSDEVQKVLIEWWKPSIGDIATGKNSEFAVISDYKEAKAAGDYKGYPLVVPLFTETQLRNFIEDSTKGKVDCGFYSLPDKRVIWAIQLRFSMKILSV